MATAAELLAEVNTAISAALTSQSYTLRGRTQTRARLDELRKFRAELLQEVQEEASGGAMSSVIEIMRPS